MFDSTARYYAKYRLKPHMSLIEELKKIGKLDGTETLLDLGSGSGTLPVFLSKFFNKIIALDPSQSMIDVGKLEAEKLELNNIEWICSSAETLPLEEIGTVDILAFRNSFHWMDQDLVLKRFAHIVTKGGIITGNGSSWNRNQEFDEIIISTIKEYMGDKRQTTKGEFRPPHRLFKDIINDSPFEFKEQNIIMYQHTYTVDDLIGLQLSTSYTNEILLGDMKESFIETLRKRLHVISDNGTIHSKEEIEVILFTAS